MSCQVLPFPCLRLEPVCGFDEPVTVLRAKPAEASAYVTRRIGAGPGCRNRAATRARRPPAPIMSPCPPRRWRGVGSGQTHRGRLLDARRSDTRRPSIGPGPGRLRAAPGSSTSHRPHALPRPRLRPRGDNARDARGLHPRRPPSLSPRPALRRALTHSTVASIETRSRQDSGRGGILSGLCIHPKSTIPLHAPR